MRFRFIFMLLFGTLLFSGCQKTSESVQTNVLPVQPNVETVMRVGTFHNIEKVIFQKGVVSVVWKDLEQDPKVEGTYKVIYAPFPLTHELDLVDGTKIGVSDKSGFIKIQDAATAMLSDGQYYIIDKKEIGILPSSQEMQT